MSERVLFIVLRGDYTLTRPRAEKQIVGRWTPMTSFSNKFVLVAAAIAVMLMASMQMGSAQDKPSPAPPAASSAPGAPPAMPMAGVPKMKAACGPDLTSFCPDLKGAEARKCLRTHRTELSPSCVAYFKARRAAAKAKAMEAPPPGSPPPAAPPQQ